MDLHLAACISNGIVSSEIYDKRNDLDCDVPRRPSYAVYISPLIRFARVGTLMHNKCLTAKILIKGYRYRKLRKAFSKLYRRHHALVSLFNVGLKYLLHHFLSRSIKNFTVTKYTRGD